MVTLDPMLVRGFEALLGVLIFSSLVGFVLSRFGPANWESTVDNLNARIRAWWFMVLLVAIVLLSGTVVSLTLFALISLLAMREYMTITPTRRGDHRTLFWAFFIITPLQYWLIFYNWYGMFVVMIPVWAFLFVPTRTALAGDTSSFLERTAKVQWGLMVCVYCLSHAPALLMLVIPGFNSPARLLFFLIVVDQLSDVLQYVFGKLMGKHRISPTVSPNKTWEGTVGGILSATVVGCLLRPFTPFSLAACAALSVTIGVAGFAGGLTMSAIKRDQGVKDYGTLIQGHGGVLDRVDSLCFAAPVFFHLLRYFYVR